MSSDGRFWALIIWFHFFADFVLQTTWMANKKYTSWFAAIVHGCAYTVPFVFITADPLKLAIIAVTHTLIDHYRLASLVPRIVNWSWRGWVWHGWLSKKSYNPNHQKSYFPPKLVWLNIVIDQIMHLGILLWVFWHGA